MKKFFFTQRTNSIFFVETNPPDRNVQRYIPELRCDASNDTVCFPALTIPSARTDTERPSRSVMMSDAVPLCAIVNEIVVVGLNGFG